jgi:hypothetical protein
MRRAAAGSGEAEGEERGLKAHPNRRGRYIQSAVEINVIYEFKHKK